MRSRSAPLLATTLVALAVSVVAARAQSSLCERYRAELASLGQSGARLGQYAAAARRQRAELDRARAYHAQLGCGRGGFVFFNEPPPPECYGLEARMRQMEAAVEQYSARARDFGGDPEFAFRRRELQAAIEQACRPRPETAERVPNLFGRLFGLDEEEFEPPPEAAPRPEYETRRQGGARVVCVRTCDGYFFPLPTGGREGAVEMCAALCPAADTEVFSMSAEADIERAVGADGKAYSDLPNASRYKKAVVASCGCKKPDESWVQVLKRAEDLLDRRKTDIIVTAQKAEELSRPKPEAPKAADGKDAKGRKTKPPAVPIASPAPPAEPAAGQALVPTAGQESAGIGPQTIDADPAVGQREGQYREIVGANGKKQRVRVVAPNMFAAPQELAKGKPR